MKSDKVVVVDYGIGNLYSVERALQFCGAQNVRISCTVEDVLSADKLILPGVGAFENGMTGLQQLGLIAAIKQHAELGKPLLGICLGMQLLASTGEEFGLHQGLDLIPGRVVPIPPATPQGLQRKVPFIGWSPLIKPHADAWNNSLLANMGDSSSVYLVHSFHFEPQNPNHLLASYNFQGDLITAAVRKDNVYGFQFHPEKSGEVGLSLLAGFLAVSL